jgi:hypothetical protein
MPNGNIMGSGGRAQIGKRPLGPVIPWPFSTCPDVATNKHPEVPLGLGVTVTVTLLASMYTRRNQSACSTSVEAGTDAVHHINLPSLGWHLQPQLRANGSQSGAGQ